MLNDCVGFAFKSPNPETPVIVDLPALSNIPQNLEFDKKNLTANVLGIIDREWIALKLNELFVIEYYSRKI